MVDKKEARDFVLEILQRLDGFAEARLEHDSGWNAWSLAVNFKDGFVGYLCAVPRNRQCLHRPTKLYVKYKLDDRRSEDVLWSHVVDYYFADCSNDRQLGLYCYKLDEHGATSFRPKDFKALPWIESRSLYELKIELDLKGMRA